MRSYKYLWFILVAALFTGCVPAAQQNSGYASTPATASPQAVSTRPAAKASQQATPQASLKASATHEAGCTVVSKQPTPTPLSDPLVPAVSDKDWVKGKPGSYVTIIDYSDFQ